MTKKCKVVFDNFFGDRAIFNWWYYQVSKLLDFVNKEVEDNQDEAESLIKHEDRRKDNLEMEIVVHHNGAYEESDRGENAKIR